MSSHSSDSSQRVGAATADMPAVVLGVCAHGLAVVRALARAGVEVFALEANASQPGVHTRLARVVMVQDVNGHGLVDALLELSRRELSGRRAVLIAINDNMVRTLAEHWPRLQQHYALSWSACRDDVAALLDKPAIEARCREQEIRYPNSVTLGGPEHTEAAIERLGFPMLVKPARPLSRFKAVRIESASELTGLIDRHRDDLPFLAQTWLTGDDERIVFAALYLVDGEVVARFEGRKIRSLPRAMGQTTAAVNAPDDEVHAIGRHFFDGLAMSGPVSLEMKRDDDGALWVIEPTVGRTDFWLDCCVANGVDLPLLEYRHASGGRLPSMRQHACALWLDSDREPALWLELVLSRGSRLRRLRPVFAYCHLSDPGPFLNGLVRQLRRALRSLRRRLAPSTSGARS